RATGPGLDAVFGPCAGRGAGETSLARLLLARLAAGDLLLGDRVFATYWLIAGVLQRQADAVFRLHAHRKRDGSSRSSRLARPLGRDDTLLPSARPPRPDRLAAPRCHAPPPRVRGATLSP